MYLISLKCLLVLGPYLRSLGRIKSGGKTFKKGFKKGRALRAPRLPTRKLEGGYAGSH